MRQDPNLPPGVTNAMIEARCAGDAEFERVMDEIDEDIARESLEAWEVRNVWKMGLTAWPRVREMIRVAFVEGLNDPGRESDAPGAAYQIADAPSEPTMRGEATAIGSCSATAGTQEERFPSAEDTQRGEMRRE